MEEKLEIPISKSKVMLMLFGSLVFVFIGVLMLLSDNTSVIEKIIGAAGILFFGLGLVMGSPQLIDRTPGMVLDKSGITDNMTKPRVGTLEWKDIARVEVTKFANTKMLLIFVYNPEKYLSRVKGRNHRGLLNNHAILGTPFVIPSSVLKMKLEVLEDIIRERIASMQRAQSL